MGRFGWRAEHTMGPRCSPDSCGSRIEASRFLSQRSTILFRMTMIVVVQALASYPRGYRSRKGRGGVNARNRLVERGTISGARLFTRILFDIIPIYWPQLRGR